MSRRILHVTSCYSTGVARAVETIVGLTPHHEHHLLWDGDARPAPGYASITPLPGGLYARVRAVRAAVRHTGAEVVHAHSSWAGVYVRLAAPAAAVVYQPHGYKLCDPGLSRAGRAAIAAAERLLGTQTDRVAVLSPQEERIAARVSPRADRELLPNVPALADRSRTPAGGPRERLVVMAGRICAQKDPAFFAATARAVRRRDPSVRFRWLGEPDESARTQTLRDAGVEISGWLAADGLAAQLGSAGVYLHSARYEGFPISVLDAAWCGAPIVVRRIAALTGTGLIDVVTPNEAARRVLAVLDDAQARADCDAAADRLLATMSTERQREAITRLYAPGD